MAAVAPRVHTSESGYQSAQSGSWWTLGDDAEKNIELQWPRSIEVFDSMRRQDPQVISVLRAVTLPIRRTSWWIDPNGARPEVVQHVAEDLGLPVRGAAAVESPLRSRDRFSWPEHLRLALTMLPFGHSFFEQVYRIDEKTGLARIRKLGWRPPRTISKVDVAADGGLVAISQHSSVTGKDAEIPVDHLVAYVLDREGGNWFGQSILRPAYKPWFLKDRALRTQAQTLERNGLGVPLYKASKMPEGMDAEAALAAEKADREAGLKLAQAWRGGDNSGASISNSADLVLRGVEGDLPDADKPVRYHDEQIARAVLAHFLNLGTETGSWALGTTFADFFVLSLQTVALDVADVATQHIVEDLVDINWGPDERAPRIAFDEIGSRHPATAEAVKALVDCGALTADTSLETHLRTVYGLPELDPETARSSTEDEGSGTSKPTTDGRGG
ncbi:phage portal protein family protein [Propionibacteriaceae bacterium Y2011]